MNLNSQFSFYPPQPDNPSDKDRYLLTQYALSEKGRPEDINYVTKLLSPPSPITNFAKPGEFKGTKICVIGGGLAGLAAAYELRKLGFDITIYEALEDRIGGRVYTYYFNEQKDLYQEFGAMRIPVSHETVWHYLKLFNLPTRPFIQLNPNAYVYYRKTRVRNDRNGYNVMKYIYPKYNLYPWERKINWQKLFYLGIDSHINNATPEIRSEILQIKRFYNEKTLFWDENSNIRMMEYSGLSQEAINLCANFLPLLYGNLYNSYIDFAQEEYPADLQYLYEIPGGTEKLPRAFYNSFMSPIPDYDYKDIDPKFLGRINYKAGCYVNEIHYDNANKKLIFKYENLKAKENMEEKFDYAVCAIPFSTLRNINIDPLFSNIKMRAIREVYYTPSQKTLLLCKERFWEKDGIVGGISFTDLPISLILFPSDHAKYINDPVNSDNQLKNLPWKEPGVIIGSYNFNLDATRFTNQPIEKLFKELKREIEMTQGLSEGYLDSIVMAFKTVNWDEEPTFRGALSFFSPEQKRIFSYGMALPEYNDRIFFAGEHISPVHRWMQGALQSGMQAANDLASACIKNRY